MGALVREVEAPLGEAAQERPSRAAWMAMWEEAQKVPVPAYDDRRILGVHLPRRPR